MVLWFLIWSDGKPPRTQLWQVYSLLWYDTSTHPFSSPDHQFWPATAEPFSYLWHLQENQHLIGVIVLAQFYGMSAMNFLESDQSFKLEYLAEEIKCTQKFKPIHGSVNGTYGP